MSDVRTDQQRGRKACEDLSRLYFLYLTRPTEETLDAFVQCCLANLKRKVRYFVHGTGICPSFMAPDVFAEDVFSLGIVKFWAGIHALRAPEQLKAWLNRVAYSAVVEEYRSRVRRTGDGPVHWVPIEQEVRGEND